MVIKATLCRRKERANWRGGRCAARSPHTESQGLASMAVSSKCFPGPARRSQGASPHPLGGRPASHSRVRAPLPVARLCALGCRGLQTALGALHIAAFNAMSHADRLSCTLWQLGSTCVCTVRSIMPRVPRVNLRAVTWMVVGDTDAFGGPGAGGAGSR